MRVGGTIGCTMSAETSPAGEADSSNESDANSSTECPTCGREDFASRHYMKVHHKQAHGESIAGELVECDWCGDEFRRLPCRTSGRNYCSDSCNRKGRSERYSGENHPRWDGGKVTVECDWCEEDYEVIQVRVDSTRFCSYDCHGAWMSENVRGNDHPSWTRIESECEICGETVHRQPSQYEAMEHVFCSQECHREYQSRHQVGENHHNYGGGRAEKYGPNWDEQAEKCRERDDYTCQGCGLPQEEHFRALTGHHIRPRKEFIDSDGNYDYEEANRLENLVALCSACHQRWEGMPVKPTFEPSS